ncbi:hypothetical protein GCM10010299_00480 [Streptomyces tanashiensis]|nr:hypothetical protein GCM10010299_00480 [Streptomyces tanashiensis]
MASTPALWRELADKLAEQIGRGEYEPGQRLPQIRDQVDAGEGSKATVHAAYKALEAEGLVTSTRGHGTVVRQQVPLKRLGHLIKAPAAHGAARAPRRPGLRSCLRPAPARLPSARLTAWVDGQQKQAFKHGNRHMAGVATSAADYGKDGRPNDSQRRGRGGLLRMAGRLPSLSGAGRRTPAVTDDGSVRRPHYREGAGGEQLLPRSGASRCGRSASVPVSPWLMSASSSHQRDASTTYVWADGRRDGSCGLGGDPGAPYSFALRVMNERRSMKCSNVGSGRPSNRSIPHM